MDGNTLSGDMGSPGAIVQLMNSGGIMMNERMLEAIDDWRGATCSRWSTSVSIRVHSKLFHQIDSSTWGPLLTRIDPVHYEILNKIMTAPDHEQ